VAEAHGARAAVLLGAAALARELDGADPALARVEAAAAPLKKALDGAKTSLDLTDRGALALATGRLGAAVRRLALAGGVVARLPYPARIPIANQSADEPISVLTLPAPRPSPGGAASAEDRRALVELGRKLFTDRRLSRDNVRSCASCHDPKQWFTDGVVAQGSLNPAVPPPRHTPTLLYTALHAAQLWDGRLLTAESQALAVIHNPAEMGLAPGELATKLAGVPEYSSGLTDPNGAISLARVADALTAFEVDALVPADAPIDELARGNDKALTEDQRRGLDVFVGKGRCARCHVPPLFGGSRPHDFAVPVFAVLGVPDSPEGKRLDPDRGRGATTRRAADEHAFKTPTVRNIAKTAPYFHHGRYARLGDVVDFYDKGGGKGLGLDVPNQDPDVVPLELTKEETRVLLVFLREATLDKTPPEAAMQPR
jgi:cytochrome c peroxidase